MAGTQDYKLADAWDTVGCSFVGFVRGLGSTFRARVEDDRSSSRLEKRVLSRHAGRNTDQNKVRKYPANDRPESCFDVFRRKRLRVRVAQTVSTIELLVRWR